MRVTLRPKAYNALIYLVFSGQDLWIQRLGLDFRNSLKRAGLVEQYKGPDRRSYLRPTDVAWDYLAEQFPAVTDPAHRARAEARPCQTTAKLSKYGYCVRASASWTSYRRKRRFFMLKNLVAI